MTWGAKSHKRQSKKPKKAKKKSYIMSKFKAGY